MRTCIGCRSRAARSELIRVVEREGGLLVDRSAVEPGRGAWVHPRLECIETATSRRAFGRALRSPISNDVEVRELARQLAADHVAARNEKADRTMDKR